MELLERFSQGDADAFEELFKRYQGEAFGWIVRIVREPAAAEDLTVETFWRVHRAHARFRPDGSFPAWLRAIATHVALDHLRRTRREVPFVVDPAAELPEPDHGDPAVHARIARAFTRLSPKLRAVALLAVVEEVPHREIASALGISEVAVRVRLFRAMRILRNTLEDLRPNRERTR